MTVDNLLPFIKPPPQTSPFSLKCGPSPLPPILPCSYTGALRPRPLERPYFRFLPPIFLRTPFLFTLRRKASLLSFLLSFRVSAEKLNRTPLRVPFPPQTLFLVLCFFRYQPCVSFSPPFQKFPPTGIFGACLFVRIRSPF